MDYPKKVFKVTLLNFIVVHRFNSLFKFLDPHIIFLNKPQAFRTYESLRIKFLLAALLVFCSDVYSVLLDSVHVSVMYI